MATRTLIYAHEFNSIQANTLRAFIGSKQAEEMGINPNDHRVTKDFDSLKHLVQENPVSHIVCFKDVYEEYIKPKLQDTPDLINVCGKKPKFVRPVVVPIT